MMLFREICKNFDEMAGRLGEIPDETKELVELQRLNLTSPTDLLIQVCFSISQRTLFQYVQLFIYICTIVILSATIFLEGLLVILAGIFFY